MALGTLGEFKTRNELTLTAAQDDAVAGVLVECEDAIRALCHPTMLEAGTATGYVLDAPWNSQFLTLPLGPVRSITSLYVRHDANGDSSLFTSDYLKTQYTDYRLVIDRYPEGWAVRRRVEILNSSFWGARFRRPHARLGAEVINVPGAVKVTFAYGYTSVPPRVSTALYIAAAMLLARRKFGAMMTSASLNGASYSLAGPATATAVVHSPDVLASLRGLYDPALVGGA